ncbi:VWA domain-containing protein [Diaminobutyricibacter tongyongensis]|uniref:VWA domain-containing protein n=1 Tax=Leifsonia tongyongensis TaxID=1268043 RepID=A0A6L9XXI3_9MICO|nr:VWA domain-containing protein [Diaminobutyricibacter tongyongensis]NEN05955.1 VWA domain-containing protein [Diaminobutyricibacter tongyongensis]
MAESGSNVTVLPRPAPRVEAAAFAAGLTTTLRRAGLPVPPERTGWLAESLRLVPPDSRDALYRTCRTVLVSTHAQLPVFEAVFSAVFDGRLDPADSRGDPNAPPSVGSEPRTRPTPPDSRPSVPHPVEAPRPPGPATTDRDSEGDESGSDDGPERDAVLAVASREERLHDMAFADLSDDELAGMRRLVQSITVATPVRPSRRPRPSAHSSARLDLRRTLRTAQRTGTDATRLVYAHRRTRPRRLVLLCDVSGSMEPYTRVFLSLLQGAVVNAAAEAFVFSTRLTRLTRQLTVRDPDQALARAAASVPDWAGGTRLADSIRRFIDDYGRRGVARGAVVVILSDGWAQDAPDEVAAQMKRLRRLAHRIVWVNPRKVAAGFQPLVGGMAAALPYCDAFVSGHSYAALQEVAAAIRADRPHPGEVRHTPSEMSRTPSEIRRA